MTKLDYFMAVCAVVAALLNADPDANAQGVERDSTHGIIRPSVTHMPPNITACVTGHGGASAPAPEEDSDDDGETGGDE